MRIKNVIIWNTEIGVKCVNGDLPDEARNRNPMLDIPVNKDMKKLITYEKRVSKTNCFLLAFVFACICNRFRLDGILVSYFQHCPGFS